LTLRRALESLAESFAHAQAVSEHHQDQEMIPDAVPALPHGDLRRAQEVFGALVAVGGLSTFDISPFGRGWRAHSKPLVKLRASGTVIFYKKHVLSKVPEEIGVRDFFEGMGSQHRIGATA
jgi:hypothetical protein